MIDFTPYPLTDSIFMVCAFVFFPVSLGIAHISVHDSMYTLVEVKSCLKFSLCARVLYSIVKAHSN